MEDFSFESSVYIKILYVTHSFCLIRSKYTVISYDKTF